MTTALALLRSALTLRTGPVVQITPAGEFAGRDGRPGNGLTWKLDGDSGRALAARMTQFHSRVRFNVDYEHQTMLTEKNGKPSPAAGWASVFEWRDGVGLFAMNMQWTARASQMIEAGEYLYLSPVILYTKATGAVLNIHNAALTNIPNLEMNVVAEEAVASLNAHYDAMFPHGGPVQQAEQLTEQERAICAAMGLDTAEYLATKYGTPAEQGEVAALRQLTQDEQTICRMMGTSATDMLAARDDMRNEQAEVVALSHLTNDEQKIARAFGYTASEFMAMKKQMA